MKSFLKSNWVTLTISFLSAVLIWIYVVYQINPIFETTIRNIPISYVRYSENFSNGKLVLSTKSNETANIRIKGKRGLLSKVTKDDINCSVDMSGVSTSGTHKIPISVSFNRSGVELVSKDPYSVNVVVDDVVTNELAVSINTKGTPASGYVYDSIQYNVDKVRITGAKSIVKKAKKAKVNVDITDKTDSVSGRYKIILEDKDGNELPEEGITKNISYIEVKCNILLLKEIPVKAQLSDEKTAGGKTVTATVNPASLKVLGSNAAMTDFTQILTEEINVRYAKDGSTITAKLEELPETVNLEDKTIEEVEVTLKVE